MFTRRQFLISSLLASAGASFGFIPKPPKDDKGSRQPSGIEKEQIKKPVVISTWNHGIPANEKAWEVLSKNGTALDAVEKGVMVVEADPKITSVGYGGWPDRDGYVTLDASIMDEKGNAGSVAFLQNILHPISVARAVMEKTPHVMIVGEGALQFARENGFEEFNLLTPESKKKWEEWLKKSDYKPKRIGEDNHDTIGMLALDENGNLSGACTTSGTAFKLHGRVGDSPIIGAGLYVDNEVGGASATGVGEAVMKTVGSFLIVELMRNGKTPQQACEIAVKRIADNCKTDDEFQVAFIALNKKGETGSCAYKKNFQYALYRNGKNELFNSEFLVNKN